MRVSAYEVVLPLIGAADKPIEGKALLINGLYGAIDVVDEVVAEKLARGALDELSLAVRERLASRGHLTRKSPEEEAEDVRLLGRIYDKTVGHSGVSLVLLPSFDCNFRCPYCFESHRLARGRDWLSRRMSPEMVDAAFAALKKLQEKGYCVESCSLYGGEPLMVENLSVVRDICEHARATGLTLDAITNGYDLDAYLDLLEEFEFERLQITVDGVGELNDRRRRHRDGVATYARIMDNVALALERGIDIQLRVNVNRENICGIPELLRDLSERGLTEARQVEHRDGQKRGEFSFYFNIVMEPLDSPTRVSERELLDALVAAGLSPLEAIKLEGKHFYVKTGLEEMATRDRYPLLSTSFCGAEKGALVVEPDGLVHNCWDLVGKDSESVGFADAESQEFVFNFNRARWRLRTSERMERCCGCPYVFLCRGGCAAEAKLESGSYFSAYCGEFREVFAYTAPRVMGSLWERSGQDELSVSLCGPLMRMRPEDRQELMQTSSAARVVEILRRVGLMLKGA